MCGWPVLTFKMPSSQFLCTSHIRNISRLGGFKNFYKFLDMPNGYSDAMQIFTKILKPVFGHLHNQGHISVIFVDDSYLQGDTKHEHMNNINATIDLLSSLGFSIHTGKTVLIPTQKTEFL